MIVLLWALRKLDALPPANQQCDTSVFLNILPPYSEFSSSEFIMAAELRPDAELIAKADEFLDLHWHARDAKLNGRPSPDFVDIEVVQERHQAINWIIGYDGGVPWDEVTTDT